MYSKEEVIKYLDENVFTPGIVASKKYNIPEIARGIRYTKMRMNQLSTTEQVIHYFWCVIIGTDKSIKFAKMMKNYNVVRFEDILEEFREKFR